MAQLFADENVRLSLVRALRALGHDVLTAYEAGRANQQIPDPDVLAYAVSLGRAVLTNNRRDYHRLHAQVPGHEGIITFTYDPDFQALADRIHGAIVAAQILTGVLIKITGPPQAKSRFGRVSAVSSADATRPPSVELDLSNSRTLNSNLKLDGAQVAVIVKMATRRYRHSFPICLMSE